MAKVSGIERVKSGVKGFDGLVGGGFIRGQSILVCGMPGTGKTIFALQFLYRGAVENNENGLFVSVEDDPEKLKTYGKGFGWDLEKLQKEGKLEFLKVPIDHIGYNIVETITRAAKKIKAQRIVVDSLSALDINARMFSLPLKDQPDPTGVLGRDKVLKVAGYAPFEDVSQFTYLFINRVNDLGATSIYLTDSPPGTELLTKDGVSEFACDGVIQMQLNDTSKNVNMTVAVKKLRGTEIEPGANLLKFTKSGLEVGEFKAFY